MAGLLSARLPQEPWAHAPSPPLSCSSAGRVRGDPAGFCSHGRKACLSTVEELPPRGGKESCGQTLTNEDPGDPGLQDKYCPFVSAYCRDQQTDELKKKIIIILIIYILKGGKSDT